MIGCTKQLCWFKSPTLQICCYTWSEISYLHKAELCYYVLAILTEVVWFSVATEETSISLVFHHISVSPLLCQKE